MEAVIWGMPLVSRNAKRIARRTRSVYHLLLVDFRAKRLRFATTFDCLLKGSLLWFESQLLKQIVHIKIDPFRANLISLKVSEGSSMKCDGAASSRCAVW